MTESEWLACNDPKPMLEFLRGKDSDRKLRLFAVAITRPISEWLVHQDSRAAVAAAERVAEGLDSPDVLPPFYRGAWDVLAVQLLSDVQVNAARAAGRTVQSRAYDAAAFTKNEVVGLLAELAEQTVATEDEQDRLYWIGKARGESLVASCLRDIFGNPFRPATIDPAVLQWNGGTILTLARAVYEDRELSSGHLDPVRLALLADMLEDAGTSDPHILEHLRGPGPHVRGCWALDLVLGKQ